MRRSAGILGALLGATMTLGVGMITDADAYRPADRTPRCIYEDGSGQARCVWDARHMGNGEGYSFIALQGGTDCDEYIRISHRRAHRLATTLR